MAKQRGVFKVNGTLDDVTFYERGGSFYVRPRVKGPSREKMMTNARYQRTRENLQEFGAASFTASSIMRAFNKVIDLRDGTLQNRLMSRIRKAIDDASGVRGKRVVSLFAQKEHFVNVELNIKQPLKSYLTCLPDMTHTNSRTEATTIIKADSFRKSINNVPSGATHVRIFQLVSIASNTVYNDAIKNYETANAALNGKHEITYSDYLDLASDSPVELMLTTKLLDGVDLPSDVSVIHALGIVFSELTFGNHYPMKQRGAMRIFDVF